jgi:hypothetical protein
VSEISAVEPSVPFASGHGVIELTPIDEPDGAVAGENASDPGAAGASASTRSLKPSAMITSLESSRATPIGSLIPLNGSVVDAPPADSSITRLPEKSVANTSPALSTATPYGRNPPTSICCEAALAAATAGAARTPTATTERSAAIHAVLLRNWDLIADLPSE